MAVHWVSANRRMTAIRAILSMLVFDSDADTTANTGPATGWSRSVLPFTGLAALQATAAVLLPKAAGRWEPASARWTATRPSGRSIINSGRSTGQRAATRSLGCPP